MGAGTEDYPGWLSLRELDAEQGLAKGTAFRAFKRLLPDLAEERDFVVLDHQRHGALAAARLRRLLRETPPQGPAQGPGAGM